MTSVSIPSFRVASATPGRLSGSISRLSSGSALSSSTAGGKSGSRGQNIDNDTDKDDLLRMQEIFEEADEDGGGGLDINEFKGAMKKVLGGSTDDKELEKLFMKVDTNCDGTVDWDEFLSYTLLEYQEKDIIKKMMNEVPFTKDEVEVERKHSELIARIRYFPLYKNQSFSQTMVVPGRGRFFSIDEVGVLNIWNANFQHTRKLRVPKKHVTPHLCRDVCLLSNLNLIVVASTIAELWIYDVNKFNRLVSITHLPYSAECLHYFFDLVESSHSILFWGDTGGNVIAIELFDSLRSGFTGDHLMNADREISLEKYMNGTFPSCKVHKHDGICGSWVRQVMYLPAIEHFICCSWSSTRSMVVSLLVRKKREPYVFDITKGITSFDYSSELNVIATAGVDHRIKLWDPYITSQPLNILAGHYARVEYVCIDTLTASLVSFSADNYVKVWDIKETSVVQSFNANYAHLQPHDVSAVLFTPDTGKMILATKEIVYRVRTGNVQTKKTKDTEDPKSHGAPVTCVQFNPVFEVVVSTDQDSTVCVWDPKDGGKKLMQFSGCHQWDINGRIINLPITAMNFDPTYRRLFTGSKDGKIKVWNFNNGNCLCEYDTCEENEIGAIVYSRNRLFTGGWSKSVYCIFDAKDDDDMDTRCWEQKHSEDILCMTKVSNYIVSADFDSDIIFWHKDTGRFAFRFNINEGPSAVGLPQNLEIQEKVSDVIKSRKSSRAETRSSRMLSSRMSKQALARERSRENIYVRGRESRFSEHSAGRGFKSASKRVVQPLEEKYCSVDCILTLHKRVLEIGTAKIICGTSFGWVYGLPAVGSGSVVAQLFAAKADKTSVSAMTCGPNGQILITGDGQGFVRVWDIKYFAVGERERQRAKSMADFEYDFVFERYMNRITRQLAAIQPIPQMEQVPVASVPLLTSFKAHITAVTCLDFIPEQNLIVSGGSNGAVKLFTAAGKSVGTFGQAKPLRSLQYYQSEKTIGKVPPTLRRVASPMSLLVMRGKKKNHWKILKTLMQTSRSHSRESRRQSRRNSDGDSSSNSDAENRVQIDQQELKSILDQEDYSFTIKSDLIGVAYKNREPTAKGKYIGGFEKREKLVETSDVYYNLNATHEVHKLPELPKPALLKEVLTKQNSMAEDVQRLRRRNSLQRSHGGHQLQLPPGRRPTSFRSGVGTSSSSRSVKSTRSRGSSNCD